MSGTDRDSSPRMMASSSAAPAYYSASMSDMPQASPQSPQETHQGFDPVDPRAAQEALAAATGTGSSDREGEGSAANSDAGGSDGRGDLPGGGGALPELVGSPEYVRPDVDFGSPAVGRDHESAPRPLGRTSAAVPIGGASSDDDGDDDRSDGGAKMVQHNSGDCHVDPAVAAELGDGGSADLMSPGPPGSPGNNGAGKGDERDAATSAKDDLGGGNGLLVTGSMAGLEAASTMYPSGTMVPTMSITEPPAAIAAIAAGGRPDGRGSPHEVSIPPGPADDDRCCADADDTTTLPGPTNAGATIAASAPVTPQRELFPGAENALAFPPQALEAALVTPAALAASSSQPGSPGILVTADDRTVAAAANAVPPSLTPADLVASGHALLHLSEHRRHVMLPAPAPRASGGCTVYTVVVVGTVCPTVVAVPSSTSLDTPGVAAAAVAEYGYRLQLARHMMQRVAVCLAHMRITVLHPVLDAATAHAHVLPAAGAGAAGGHAAMASSKRAPTSVQSSPQAKATTSPSSTDLLAAAEDWAVVLYGPPGVRASIAAVDHRPRGQCPCGLLECFPTAAVRNTTVGVVAAVPHVRTVLGRQSEEYRPFASH